MYVRNVWVQHTDTHFHMWNWRFQEQQTSRFVTTIFYYNICQTSLMLHMILHLLIEVKFNFNTEFVSSVTDIYSIFLGKVRRSNVLSHRQMKEKVLRRSFELQTAMQLPLTAPHSSHRLHMLSMCALIQVVRKAKGSTLLKSYH